jgi:hypothetical protein
VEIKAPRQIQNKDSIQSPRAVVGLVLGMKKNQSKVERCLLGLCELSPLVLGMKFADQKLM